ncbi:hypothetical protein LMTR3_21405 [Bradyrhizobium sp. LMTR 3]|nr:hypothetical protein LMTR3_21405 [Bradyrhizobium sp. LMTR 3]
MGRSASPAAQDAFSSIPPSAIINHPPDGAVRDSLVEESAQVRVVDGVEVFRDIDVHNPATIMPSTPGAPSLRVRR